MHLRVLLLMVLLAATGCTSRPAMSPADQTPPVATFSIVALDPQTGELGIAVQSKFIAVGSVVPWAQAGVGAIATQSWANTTYGPRGLALLEQGLPPDEVLAKLLADDEGADRRQVGIIDAQGRTAAHTGAKCNDWAGHRAGENYTAQGNILAGEQVVNAMAETFEQAEGDLGERLIAALIAGQAAGGDARGKQSAALYIVRDGGGYSGFNDRYRDIRVDDHPEPIQELLRIYRLHKQIFPPPDDEPE